MSRVLFASMPTDYDLRSATPIEWTFVKLVIDTPIEITPEMEAVMRKNMKRELESNAKAMPHRYWNQLEKELP